MAEDVRFSDLLGAAFPACGGVVAVVAHVAKNSDFVPRRVRLGRRPEDAQGCAGIIGDKYDDCAMRSFLPRLSVALCPSLDFLPFIFASLSVAITIAQNPADAKREVREDTGIYEGREHLEKVHIFQGRCFSAFQGGSFLATLASPRNPHRSRPRNIHTGKMYQGVNGLLLGMESRPSPWQMTFQQATLHGGCGWMVG